MKIMQYIHTILSLSIMFGVAFCPLCLAGQSVYMTFNLRFDNPADGFHDWDHRKESVVSLLKKYQPDVLGTQEGLLHQLQYLDEQLPEYTFFGLSRDDGGVKGEFCGIFYRTDRFELLNTETIWLSETRKTGSRGWDAALPRILTYGVLKSLISGDTVHVFNAHFDHMGSLARLESVKIILDLIKEKNLHNKTLVVMGDFNATAAEQTVQILKAFFLHSSLDCIDQESIQSTFNAFGDKTNTDRIIDHIFVNRLKVKSCQIIYQKREDGGFISDHFPVLLTTE